MLQRKTNSVQINFYSLLHVGLPISLEAKELWKSVNIWGSCGQEFSVLFFDLWCKSSGVEVPFQFSRPMKCEGPEAPLESRYIFCIGLAGLLPGLAKVGFVDFRF